VFIGAGFGLFLLLFVTIVIGSFVIAIMTAIDSSKYPEWAFQHTGSSKFVWQLLPIILLVVCQPAGGVIGLIWYTGKRHEVERAALAGGPPPYYGALPPTYLPPPTWGGQSPPSGWAPPPQPPQPPPAPPSAPASPAPPSEPPQ
jgi:hypothetical protein